MPHRPNLFEEFDAVSKADWLEKIKKDLKGKAVEELTWQVDDLEIAPFHHLDERKEHPVSLQQLAGWVIGEAIPAHDISAANSLAQRAVKGGAESLEFFIDEPLGDHRLEGLLDGINPEQISLQFHEENKNADPVGLLRHIHHFATKKGCNSAALTGAIKWSNQAPIVVDDVSQLLQFTLSHLPGFRVLPVQVVFEDNPMAELVSMLRQLDHWLERLTDAGFSSTQILKHTQISLAVSSNYFVSLCKLRAVRMLFHHLAETWQAAASPFLDVSFSAYPGSEAPYNNLIHATTQAISAIAGGADRITVMPADVQQTSTGESSPTFRRLARNLHHILRSESYLDAVADPAAGSYFFEDLTEKMAAMAWQQFAEGIEKK